MGGGSKKTSRKMQIWERTARMKEEGERAELHIEFLWDDWIDEDDLA